MHTFDDDIEFTKFSAEPGKLEVIYEYNTVVVRVVDENGKVKLISEKIDGRNQEDY